MNPTFCLLLSACTSESDGQIVRVSDKKAIHLTP